MDHSAVTRSHEHKEIRVTFWLADQLDTIRDAAPLYVTYLKAHPGLGAQWRVFSRAHSLHHSWSPLCRADPYEGERSGILSRAPVSVSTGNDRLH